MNNKLYALFVCLLALTGCAENNVTTMVATNDDYSQIDNQLLEVANRIHEVNMELVALKKLSPHDFTPKKTPVDGPLSKAVSLKWTGSPEEAVKTICALVGFASPKIIGRPPSNIKAVTIFAKNKAAFEVLEDIGLQMGDFAGLNIGSDKVTIVYEGSSQ